MNLSECPPGIVTPDLFHTVAIALFSLVVLVGLLGNALVIVVILANSHMRNSTNILIMSLAVADLLFITLCVPFTALIYKFTWRFGHAWCVVFQYFSFVPVYGSVYTLVLMSADRYLAVVHPIRSLGWRTQVNTVAAVTVTWLLIAVGHVPLALDVRVLTNHCGINCSVGGDCQPFEIGFCANPKFFVDMGATFTSQGVAFYTAFNALGYLLPFIVIITLYVLLVKQLLFGRRSQLAQSTGALRSKRRVTRTVVTVVAIFGTCWLPIHVIFALQIWHGDVKQNWFRYLQLVSQVLAYTNSCMNPIVYAFVSDNFRQAFASFLGIPLAARGARTNDGNRRPLLSQTERRQQLLEEQPVVELTLPAQEEAALEPALPTNGQLMAPPASAGDVMEMSQMRRNTLELTAQVHAGVGPE